METDLGCGLGRQALLIMHQADLQEKENAFSINTEYVVTSRTQKRQQG